MHMINVLIFFRFLIFLLILSLPDIVHSANTKISKNLIAAPKQNSLDYFDPMLELKKQAKGETFYKLYLNVEKKPDEIIQLLSTTDYASENNFYYVAIRYLILYKAYIALGERKKSYQAMQALEAYANKNNVDWLKGDSLMWQSTYLFESTNNKQALELLRQAVLLANSSNYPHLKARSINIQAIIYSNNNDKLAAVDAYLKAINIFEKLKDYAYLSKVYSNLSIEHMQLQQWPQAREFLIKSLDIYKKK